jgi:hypothetical protein
LLHLDVSTKQGPELHLDVSGQQEPVLVWTCRHQMIMKNHGIPRNIV